MSKRDGGFAGLMTGRTLFDAMAQVSPTWKRSEGLATELHLVIFLDSPGFGPPRRGELPIKSENL